MFSGLPFWKGKDTKPSGLYELTEACFCTEGILPNPRGHLCTRQDGNKGLKKSLSQLLTIDLDLSHCVGLGMAFV